MGSRSVTRLAADVTSAAVSAIDGEWKARDTPLKTRKRSGGRGEPARVWGAADSTEPADVGDRDRGGDGDEDGENAESLLLGMESGDAMAGGVA